MDSIKGSQPELYRNFTGVTYTHGVRDLAEEKGAYWLIDAIGSHVVANPDFLQQCRKDERFERMQIWILKENGGNVQLIAVSDTGEEEKNPPILQEVGYSDFDFDESGECKLYCAANWDGEKKFYTILKPSEY
jgi:hypothetical protein